jgi:hypothetical protein
VNVYEQRAGSDHFHQLPHRLRALAGAADAPPRTSARKRDPFVVTAVHETQHRSARNEAASSRSGGLNSRDRGTYGELLEDRLRSKHRMGIHDLGAACIYHRVQCRERVGPTGWVSQATAGLSAEPSVGAPADYSSRS